MTPQGTYDRLPSARSAYVFPASFSQRYMWFLDQLGMGGAAYNIPSTYLIEGPLDLELMQRCLAELLSRHESLRTGFDAVEGEPRQVVYLEVEPEIEVTSLLSLSGERDAEAAKLAQEEVDKSFDLTRPPLIRVRLLQVASERHVLLITLHHIIADGWSLALICREIGVLYASFAQGLQSPLPELPIQYADFSQWQREWLSGEVLEQLLAYWKQQVSGIRPLQIPLDHPRPEVQTQRGSHVRLTLDREVTRKLHELGRIEGATLYMVLLAAFQVLLYRYSGQHDIAVGSPIAGRTRVEFEGVVGLFKHGLVMRTDLSRRPSFRTLLSRVKQVALDAFAHQDLPLAKLIESLDLKRDPSRTPFFQAWLALQNLPRVETMPLTQETTLRPFPVTSDTSKTDLALFLAEGATGLYGSLVYNSDLFDRPTIAEMAERFEALLRHIADDSACTIDELPLPPATRT